MTGKALIDTNILVYAYDLSESEKQQKSVAVIDRLVVLDSAVISSQVLAEFFTIVTRKLPEPLTLEDAEKRVVHFCQIWSVLQVNEMIIFEAIRGVKTHKFSYWDALIWATARLNQIGTIISEDFSHDSYVEGVRFVNPLI
jgi:predicted nucleic acid-binding protein